MTDTQKTAREQCEHALKHLFSASIAGYYKRFPDRLDDPSLEQDITRQLALMNDIFHLLDKYDIAFPGERRGQK